jgi:cell division protein FtsI/penicillin-binding protein 2
MELKMRLFLLRQTVTTLVLIVLFAFFGFLWHKQVLAHDRHQGLDKPNSRSVVVHPSRGS